MSKLFQDLPTPCIVVDAAAVRRNLQRMADYTKSHNLKLRPHTKTHKSKLVGKMQMEFGATGLTVAKAGEALVMAQSSNDILMAYPPVDPVRSHELAKMAISHTVRVGLDSDIAATLLAAAAQAQGSTIGILVDLDVGHHRTGVQSPADALALAQFISKTPGLRLDGIMFFPGHVGGTESQQTEVLSAMNATLGDIKKLWSKAGLEAKIISGGSTPAAAYSHVLTHMTEIRPGTYVYNDMNGVYGKSATLDDCAARIIATVVSTAVPNQIVIDAGTKTLTSDRNAVFPDSGHGYVMEYPEAKIAKLSEEHGQVDVSKCSSAPKVGNRVTVIPNHICPCVNLQNSFWWVEQGEAPIQLPVDARGRVS